MSAEDSRSGELLALFAAVLLMAGIVVFVGSCGSEDLVFPGDIPNTATGAPTSTSTPI